MSDERVYRWRPGAAAAAGLVALGLLYASPPLLAAAVIPLGYVCYGALSAVPAAAVRVERSFGNTTPPPSDRVTVALTATNDSEATLADVRIVDGVPDDLAVVSGSPRGCGSLRPGESLTVRYEVTTRRGDFEFADPVVRLRSFSAGRVVTETAPATGESVLSSLDPVSAPPVGSTTLARAGTYPTDSGGEGLEFHSTREYRPGDSISRIHWRRFGKTGDLTTVSFREERAVRVVVVVDARPPGRRRPAPGTPTAASLTGYAAERFYETLRDAGVTTGVAAFGVDGADPSVPTGPGPVPWVGGGHESATALARTLFGAVQRVADDPTTADVGPSGSDGTGPQAAAGGAVAPRPERQAEPTAAHDSTTAGEEAEAATRETPTEPADATGSDSTERPAPDGGADDVEFLLSQFPPNAHVLFASPVADDWPVEFVRRVRRRGYPVTVFSPGVTAEAGNAGPESGDTLDADSLGPTVATHERAVRLSALSATGVTVVDWDRSTSVEVALASAMASLPGETDG